MEYQFGRGDKLVLELINSDEVLEGEFVDGSKNRLTLINITSYRSDNVIKGPYTYYRSDISNVRVLSESTNNENITDTNKIRDKSNYCDTILIAKEEYQRLREMSCNYIYMGSLDSRYYDAINYIKTCESIGIAVITTSYEKTACFNLLIISTWDQVYIIDFLVINSEKFPLELKEVLECDYIKKILHDARLFVEILTKRFNIHLKNIFDTKVADIAIRKKKGELPQQSRSLAECLVHYFNFPASLFGSQTIKLEKWKRRPLSDFRKFKAAQMATFLIMLKNHFEGVLLKDFYKAVDDYSKSLCHCSMKDVATKLFDTEVCDILQSMKLE